MGSGNGYAPPKKAAEAHYCVANAAGHFLDHQCFDLPDFGIIRPIHAGTLYAPTRDQLVTGHDVA